MDAKQIQLLKETHMKETERGGKTTTLGAYMRFCLDGGIDFVTSKDMVVFDDANNMLHCVAVNEDGRSQADYPVKVISTDYGIVQQVESIYSQKDFETMLKEGFLNGVVSEDKRNAMLSWSRNIRNQAIQPSRPTPYYSIDPTIVPMGNTSMPRVDNASGSKPDVPVVRSASSAEDITKMIENGILKSGDTVVVDSDVVFDEDFIFKGDGITLRSSGATFNGTLTAEGKDIVVEGFNFACTNDATNPTEPKGTYMLKLNGNATISGCTFAPAGCYYNAINSTGDLILSGNNFEGCDSEHIYNLIEFSQKDDQKVKNVEIAYNTFGKGASKNNTISIFQFEDGATVNILNNVWDYAANAVRVSNYSKAVGVTINCVDNEYKETSEDEYAGFLLAQGTPQNKDMSEITVNFIRLVGPDGKIITENGTGANQVWYTYDTEADPIVRFN